MCTDAGSVCPSKQADAVFVFVGLPLVENWQGMSLEHDTGVTCPQMKHHVASKTFTVMAAACHRVTGGDA